MCSCFMEKNLELSAGIALFSNEMLMWDGEQNVLPFFTVAACRKKGKKSLPRL